MLDFDELKELIQKYRNFLEECKKEIRGSIAEDDACGSTFSRPSIYGIKKLIDEFVEEK